MTDYESNVYYHPEKSNLTLVGAIEWSGESYQFNMTIVLRHNETGVYYVESDSGCSCPSPFEGISDLDKLARYDWAGAIIELNTKLGDRKREAQGSIWLRVNPSADAEVKVIMQKIMDLR